MHEHDWCTLRQDADGKTIFLVCKWLFLLLEMYTSCILRSVSEPGLYLVSPRPAKTDPSLDPPCFPCNKNTTVSEGGTNT